MNSSTYLRAGERQVAFKAPPALARALDAAAGREGVSRAGFVRKLVADALRNSGALPANARAFPGSPPAEVAE